MHTAIKHVWEKRKGVAGRKENRNIKEKFSSLTHTLLYIYITICIDINIMCIVCMVCDMTGMLAHQLAIFQLIMCVYAFVCVCVCVCHMQNLKSTSNSSVCLNHFHSYFYLSNFLARLKFVCVCSKKFIYDFIFLELGLYSHKNGYTNTYIDLYADVIAK